MKRILFTPLQEQCSVAGMTDENAANFYSHIVADSSEYVDPVDRPEERSDKTKVDD